MKKRKAYLPLVIVVCITFLFMGGCAKKGKVIEVDASKQAVADKESAAGSGTSAEKKYSKDGKAIAGESKAMAESQASDSDMSASAQGKKSASSAKGKQAGIADTYVVKKGDCLWNIAKNVYKNPLKWRLIYKANKGKIKNPDLIYPGQKFKIPRV